MILKLWKVVIELRDDPSAQMRIILAADERGHVEQYISEKHPGWRATSVMDEGQFVEVIGRRAGE